MVTSSPGDSLDNSVGTNVSFTCEASGVGLGMRWYRNGEELFPGPRVVISGFTMIIYGLLDGDLGMYQCSLSNGTSSIWRQWRVVDLSECAYVIRDHTCRPTGIYFYVTNDIFRLFEIHMHFGFNQYFCKSFFLHH